MRHIANQRCDPATLVGGLSETFTALEGQKANLCSQSAAMLLEPPQRRGPAVRCFVKMPKIPPKQ